MGTSSVHVVDVTAVGPYGEVLFEAVTGNTGTEVVLLTTVGVGVMVMVIGIVSVIVIVGLVGWVEFL